MSFVYDPRSVATLPPGAELEPSAAARVLAIPELLESILFYLPMRDLLLAQSVNHTFHSVISSTRSLQENLFFRPRLPTTRDGSAQRQINELLHPDVAPWFRAVLYVRKGSDGRVHPVRTSRNNCLIRLAPHSGSNKDINAVVSDSYTRFMRKDASWRRMLPTQPPPKSVWLVSKMPDILDFFGRRPRTDHDELLRASDGKPITMDKVYNTARLFCEKAPSAEGYVCHVDILLTCGVTEGSEEVDDEYISLTRMETRLTTRF